MAQEPNITGIALNTRMVFLIQSAVFAGFGQVAVQDGSTVQDYFNFRAVHDYFLVIPLAGWF